MDHVVRRCRELSDDRDGWGLMGVMGVMGVRYVEIRRVGLE